MQRRALSNVKWDLDAGESDAGESHVEDESVVARDEQHVLAMAHPPVADRRPSQVMPAPIVHDDMVRVRDEKSLAANPNVRTRHEVDNCRAGDKWSVMERRRDGRRAAQKSESHDG